MCVRISSNYGFTLKPLSFHGSTIHLFYSDKHTWMIISLCDHHILHDQGSIPLRNSLQQINHSTFDFQFTYFFSFTAHVIHSMGVGEPLTCRQQYIFILLSFIWWTFWFLMQVFLHTTTSTINLYDEKSRKTTAPRFPSCISNNSTSFLSQFSTQAQSF